MTRDEALIRAALGMAADALQSIADNWDCGHNESRLCDCGPYVEQWGFAAEEVRAIDPAEVLAKVPPAPTDATGYLNREAEYYDAINGQLDGIPFAHVAHICRVMSDRIARATPPQEASHDHHL